MADVAEQLQNALGSNYQLDRELPGGGMSRVFVATEVALGRKVVVKVLPPELAAGVNRDRFRREIQVVAQLQHPHIVPLLSAGEQGDLLWYTMPYIEGESLKTALERKKQFTARDVVRILHDIVDALAFAHARGVIHRDIKPANVLAQGAHALVTDFGVAKALSAALPLSGVTSAGIAIGTPAYMAPEQLAGDPTADHRMDIYAVGLLAYELVTGSSPFTGPSPRETLAAQLTRIPKPLHELATDLPRSLSDLIMRCLAKDPNARPQSADEVLHELDALTLPISAFTSKPRAMRGRRGPWIGVAVITLSCVILASVGYVMTRPSPAAVPNAAQTNAADKTAADSVNRGVALAAPAPAASAPALPAPPAKPTISHEDSIHIAAAVAKRIALAKTADSAAKAKLAAETERRLVDSIIAANSGVGATTAGTPRRVVIVEPPPARGWPETEILGRAVSDSLTRMLRARSRQYAVVDQDSVRMLVARSTLVGDVMRGANADLLIQIQLIPTRGDSAILGVQLFDGSAIVQFGRRRVDARPVPRNSVLGGLDVALLSTMTLLDEMSRAPRRVPASNSP